MDPKYEAKFRDLEHRLLDGPGTLDPAIRGAAAGSGGVAVAVDAYVEKVRRHAYEVTDADIHALEAAGYSEDQIFELTVATAFGAARKRLLAVLDAMGERSASATEGGRR